MSCVEFVEASIYTIGWIGKTKILEHTETVFVSILEFVEASIYTIGWVGW